MAEEKKSDNKSESDGLIHPEGRPDSKSESVPEARMEETSLIRSNFVTPISSMGQVAYNNYNPPPDETPNIREYWRKIRKRKWLVLAVTVIVTTIVAIESFRVKSLYRATATVALNNDNPAVLKVGEMFFGPDSSERIKTDLLLLRTSPLLAK